MWCGRCCTRRVRPAAVIIAILTLTAPAHADILWAVYAGGGLEGGTITPAVRPDAVIEGGQLVELLHGNVGVAVSVEVVKRLTSRFDDAEELKADAMFRWASDDRRLRIGVGAGLRQVSPTDGGQAIHGVDLLRLDLSAQLLHAEQGDVAPGAAIDAYVSWTFGCYSDDYKLASVGDQAPVMRSIGCAESVTTTYVLGLRTSISWR
ncbi:hypothetical protein BH11MYX3_BH11MYX3_11280 [soil metagenome]